MRPRSGSRVKSRTIATSTAGIATANIAQRQPSTPPAQPATAPTKNGPTTSPAGRPRFSIANMRVRTSIGYWSAISAGEIGMRAEPPNPAPGARDRHLQAGRDDAGERHERRPDERGGGEDPRAHVAVGEPREREGGHDEDDAAERDESLERGLVDVEGALDVGREHLERDLVEGLDHADEQQGEDHHEPARREPGPQPHRRTADARQEIVGEELARFGLRLRLAAGLLFVEDDRGQRRGIIRVRHREVLPPKPTSGRSAPAAPVRAPLWG